MVRRERNSRRFADQENAGSTGFRELHARFPTCLGIDVRAHHEERILGGVQAIGECPEFVLPRYWLPRHAAADQRSGAIFVRLGSPVIERN